MQCGGFGAAAAGMSSSRVARILAGAHQAPREMAGVIHEFAAIARENSPCRYKLIMHDSAGVAEIEHADRVQLALLDLADARSGGPCRLHRSGRSPVGASRPRISTACPRSRRAASFWPTLSAARSLQRGLDRQQQARAAPPRPASAAASRAARLHGLRLVEGGDAGAPQRDEVAEAAERRAPCRGRARARRCPCRSGPRTRRCRRPACRRSVERVDLHRSRLQLDDLARARQIVGAVAVDLDGGVRRRRLQDLAGEARQQRLDGRPRGAQLAGLRRSALGIVGVGAGAPAHGEAVVLGAVDGVGHGLGRLAERDRQHAGRQRVERAGVAGLARVEQRGARRRPPASTSCRPACPAPASRGSPCPSCGVPCALSFVRDPGAPCRSPAAARCDRLRRRSRRPGSACRARTSD